MTQKPDKSVRLEVDGLNRSDICHAKYGTYDLVYK